jgi:hypothetical protein
MAGEALKEAGATPAAANAGEEKAVIPAASTSPVISKTDDDTEPPADDSKALVVFVESEYSTLLAQFCRIWRAVFYL